jgi:hypothetical protein
MFCTLSVYRGRNGDNKVSRAKGCVIMFSGLLSLIANGWETNCHLLTRFRYLTIEGKSSQKVRQGVAGILDY